MTHRVLMNFMQRDGWRISFLEADCKTSLPLQLNFVSTDKIREMHERYGALRMLEDKAALEHGIEIGRGGVWLNLTDEQYGKLHTKEKKR
jgi:hypothetical protein